MKELFKNIMEGYSDKVIPLLSDLITENDDKYITDENASADQMVETCFSSKKKGNTKRVKAEVSHQSLVSMETIQKKSKRDLIQPHLSEKERRIKMAEKYSVLRSLLPNLKYKRSQTVIIEEAVKYIKNLEEELERLEESKKKKKKELSKTSTNSFRNSIVDVTVSGQAAFFGIQVEINNSAEEPFLFSRVMKVFEYYKTEILTATITTRNELKMKIIRLSVSILINEAGGGDSIIEEIKKGINRLVL
ncbi:hypothetical protein MKW92_003128 [Papaver armeniacum]|nr:hypothetical protein MKW92_003128 [Papaver armeniacum]